MTKFIPPAGAREESISIAREYVVTANHRFDRFTLARMVRHLRRVGLYLGTNFRNKNSWYHLDHVQIDVVVTRAARGGCRDVANYAPSVKALVDGIRDAHVIEDDDNRHLTGPFLHDGGRDEAQGGSVTFSIFITPA